MTEALKTVVFLVAAVVTVTAAYLLNSVDNTVDVQQYVGQKLTEEIDLDAPRRLAIVKFDRSTASVRKFEVAEYDGVWSIPSKENYPADATQQMADAVTSLMGRRILRIAGDTAQSHAEYGVVDPLSEKLDSRSTGVGTRVTMTDADDAVLLDLIIGKAVKDNPAQRYVRRVNQDVVYVVELDPTKLSTNFSDWIEDHLLQISTMDLRKLFIDDYSAELRLTSGDEGVAVMMAPRAEITLSRADETADWRLSEIKKGDKTGFVADQIADDEDVNQEAVTDLINGLDELLIVDVTQKPAGISADLKAGEAFINDDDAWRELALKGFFAGRQRSGADLVSSEGALVCSQRNGVEYVLRFGQLQVQTDEEGAAEAEELSNEEAASPDGKRAESAAAKSKDLRRYLFVSARFNEDAVEKPAYKPLPELPAQPAAPSEGSEAADEGDAAADDATADDEATNNGDADAESEGAEDEAADDEGNDDEADDSEADAERERIVAEREAIEAENAGLREDYEKLITDGQAQVARLNERFGDWYYVISNDMYKKIHLGREQVIKKKAAEGAEGAADEGNDASGLPAGLPDLGGAVAPAGQQ